jgi:5-formyltetrahydrofolate cyclo-ligase
MDAKRLLRSRLLAARAARPAADLAAAAVSLAEHGAAEWGHLPRLAAYAGVGGEPPTRALLDRLLSAGCTVVLPVVTETELRWAPYNGWDVLVAGSMGLLQPAGPTSGSDALASAEVLLVPALAVDVHGNRLGRGKGYYDRALAEVAPERAVAVVYDDEVLDEVPVEAHDRPVGAVLTPSGLRVLGS